MKIKHNVGGLDSVLRLGIGGGLIYLGFINTEFLDDPIAESLLGIFGLIVFVSGAMRFCPLYNLIGFSSRMQE